MKLSFFISAAITCMLGSINFIQAKDIETIQSLTESKVISAAVDYHLQDISAPLQNECTIDLQSEEAWLFFDNIKPSQVLKKYKSSILINGEILVPSVNARIAIYKQGTIVIPQGKDFQPLEAYTEENYRGTSMKYSKEIYYTNAPVAEIPEGMSAELKQDNAIRSFKLKRGYMLTLANEADGTGYSRVFIADDDDLLLSELPHELDGKVSFIRVLKWEWPSKKGWVGSVDKNQSADTKYVLGQCDKTNSTWYYNWSPTTDWTDNPDDVERLQKYNAEFVPEKWGHGGESDWRKVFAVKDCSHLLGYNEPDHTEQSNVSVTNAIEEWPKLLQTGMRLGSPATTNYEWLYSFLDECDRRNYRVDYVVVHAYWGGLTGREWYNQLKTIHEKSGGRSLWIKEWNSGANWTNEKWPSGTEAQQQRMLRDLKEILTVMDTAHFVERYSIYNWVEDKRAMILKGQLTPAGKYYADNTPEYCFDRENEIIPTWRVREAPELFYSYDSNTKQVVLSWNDVNGEMIETCNVERSLDGKNYTSIATVEYPYIIKEYRDNLMETPTGTVYYRLISADVNGKGKTSNVVQYDWIANAKDNISCCELITKNSWRLALYSNPNLTKMVNILGTPTYRNKSALIPRLRNIVGAGCEYILDSWDYLQHPTFSNPDTVALLSLPYGQYKLKDIEVNSDSVSQVGAEWKEVPFWHSSFSEAPVVLCSQITNNSGLNASVRIRNISRDGFEICLQYEAGAIVPEGIAETVNFVAMSQGNVIYNDMRIQVACTKSAMVGDRANAYTIDLGSSSRRPLFWGAMQTERDGMTAGLRIKSRSNSNVEVFKECDASMPCDTVIPEVVGWLAIVPTAVTDVEQAVTDTKQPSVLIKDDYVYLADDKKADMAIYSLAGELLFSFSDVHSANISLLERGIYILCVNGNRCFKFVKN